jgi:hypothetical protein
MAKVMAKHWRTSPHYYGYPNLLVLPILSLPAKNKRHDVQSSVGTVRLMPLMLANMRVQRVCMCTSTYISIKASAPELKGAIVNPWNILQPNT